LRPVAGRGARATGLRTAPGHVEPAPSAATRSGRRVQFRRPSIAGLGCGSRVPGEVSEP
jgi:hypothetical protein